MDDAFAGFIQARLLAQAMDRDHFTVEQLWLGYGGLGGTVEQFELQAYLHQCLRLDGFQRDLLVHTANHLLEAHHHPALPYTRDLFHREDTAPGE